MLLPMRLTKVRLAIPLFVIALTCLSSQRPKRKNVGRPIRIRPSQRQVAVPRLRRRLWSSKSFLQRATRLVAPHRWKFKASDHYSHRKTNSGLQHQSQSWIQKPKKGSYERLGSNRNAEHIGRWLGPWRLSLCRHLNFNLNDVNLNRLACPK